MLNKTFKLMLIVMLAFALMGFGVSTSFAKKSEDKASKSQACEHASDNAIAKANPNSALGNCTPVVDEPPADEPPADDPPADPCLGEDYFWSHLSECAV